MINRETKDKYKQLTARELLNKIIWDKNENPKEYKIFYLDRIDDKKHGIDFSEIKRIEGNFIIVKREDSEEETEIPIHRIREIRKENHMVWERK